MPTLNEIREVAQEYQEAIDSETSFVEEFSQIFAKREQLKQQRMQTKQRLDDMLWEYKREFPNAKELFIPNYTIVYDTPKEFKVNDTFTLLKRLLDHCTLTNEPIDDYVSIKKTKVEPLVTKHKHVTDSPLRIVTRDETTESGDGYAYVPVDKLSYRKAKD